VSEVDLTALTDIETHVWDLQAEGAELEEPRTRRTRPPIMGLLGLAYLALVFIAAIFAPWVAPHDPNAQDVFHQFQRPIWGTHLLGTDELGRDELSRLIYGARVSLLAALIGTSVALIAGGPLGILAGYTRGAVESVSNFLFDALMSMPAVIFALAVLAVLGSGVTNAMIAIGIVISPVFFRLARAATLNVRSETFIEASVVIGCTRRRVIWRHVVPNALTPILVQAAVIAGVCIVAEAGISFLGFGVRPPNASWGAMLFNSQQNLSLDAWLVYLPGIAIALTVLAFSLVGDWLRHLLSVSRRPGAA
jgi:ABC-type dipeptide/oligopeptide/nickel transport system permease subunit